MPESQELWQVGAVAYAGRRPSQSSEFPLGMHLFLVLKHTEHGPTISGATEIFVPYDPDLRLDIGAIYHMRVVQGSDIVPQLRIEEDAEPVSYVTDGIATVEWVILHAAVEASILDQETRILSASKNCQEALSILLAPIRSFLANSHLDDHTRKVLTNMILTELIK